MPEREQQRRSGQRRPPLPREQRAEQQRRRQVLHAKVREQLERPAEGCGQRRQGREGEQAEHGRDESRAPARPREPACHG